MLQVRLIRFVPHSSLMARHASSHHDTDDAASITVWPWLPLVLLHLDVRSLYRCCWVERHWRHLAIQQLLNVARDISRGHEKVTIPISLDFLADVDTAAAHDSRALDRSFGVVPPLRSCGDLARRSDSPVRTLRVPPPPPLPSFSYWRTWRIDDSVDLECAMLDGCNCMSTSRSSILCSMAVSSVRRAPATDSASSDDQDDDLSDSDADLECTCTAIYSAAYRDGRLRQILMTPSSNETSVAPCASVLPVFECHSACCCFPSQCGNRVVQHGLSQELEVCRRRFAFSNQDVDERHANTRTDFGSQGVLEPSRVLQGLGSTDAARHRQGLVRVRVRWRDRFDQRGQGAIRRVRSIAPRAADLSVAQLLARGSRAYRRRLAHPALFDRRDASRQRGTLRQSFVRAQHELGDGTRARCLPACLPAWCGQASHSFQRAQVRVGSVIPRIAFFAARDIAAGEELTFSYGGDAAAQQGADDSATPRLSDRLCLCGSDQCMGALPFDER